MSNLSYHHLHLLTNGSHLRTYEYGVDVNGCSVILAGNASLAAEWENIPETLLLNGVIGVVLFTAFLILTNIAWRRAETDDRLKNQNIITFLYGYRDPEHWYIIPRFEFLRHEERHHQHDLNWPYIYAPPKLPLANPLEIFANNENDVEQSKSADTNQDRGVPSSSSSSVDILKPVDPLPVPTKQPLVSKQAARDKKPPTANKGTKDERSKSYRSVISTASLDGPADKPQSEVTPVDLEAPMKSINKSPKSPINSATLSTLKESAASSNSDNKLANPMERRDTLKSGASFFYPSILTAEQLQASALSRKLNKLFSLFFRVTDADIIYARGIDAYEYLLFQRHLILILVITNVLCLGIILPIHWFGGTTGDNGSAVIATSFQRTTIKNIKPASANLHWAHIFCVSLIVLISLRVMRSYRDSIITPNDQQLSRRTLLIGNIPSEQRTRSQLLKILRENFSRLTIEAIQFVYDTALLYDDEMYLSSTIVAKEYCLAYKRKHNKDIKVHRTDVNTNRYCEGYCRCCSFLYVGCCYWPYEQYELGSSYYAKEEEYYREKISKCCERLIKEPTEFAFITFKTHKQAKRVMHELANMKQDMLEGKTPHRGAKSRGANRKPDDDQSSPSPHGPSSKDSLKQRQPKQGSKFIEAGRDEVNDPLDPKNNPHVRSIRSPSMHQLKHLDRALATSRQAASSSGSNSDSWRSHINDGPLMWSIRYAPHPDNIDFQDLLNLARTSPLTIVLLYLLMIIIFIFITTPNVILSMIERISILRPDKAVQLTGFQTALINYMSILLQIITTAILPALITIISRQIPYEDSASKGHSVMWKTYLFLVLMVIVMPSIGMSSALAFFDSKVNPKCLFPTDNGAYYINYVISSIFLSTMLELIKPVDILSYYFILWTSRSTAEIEGGRQFIEREFSVGIQHTGVLLIFSVVMTYSISCPLIAPVGLIYLIVKHSVDHYNLYYTYFTKKVDKDMQSTIVIFVKVALLLMLFQTSVAIYIHTGTGYFSLISQMIFWVTLAAFIFNCFFDCTSRSLPPASKRARYQHDFCACFYLPKVISSLLRLTAIPADCISRKV